MNSLRCGCLLLIFFSTKFKSYQHGVDMEPNKCTNPHQTLFYMNTHVEHRATWLSDSIPGLIDLKSELMAEVVDTGGSWLGLAQLSLKSETVKLTSRLCFLFFIISIIRLYEVHSCVVNKIFLIFFCTSPISNLEITRRINAVGVTPLLNVSLSVAVH